MKKPQIWGYDSIFLRCNFAPDFKLLKKQSMELDKKNKDNQDDKEIFLPKEEIEIFECIYGMMKNVQENLQKCLDEKIELKI